MLLMRGLTKLSQAVVETQANAMRSGTGKYDKNNQFTKILFVLV